MCDTKQNRLDGKSPSSAQSAPLTEMICDSQNLTSDCSLHLCGPPLHITARIVVVQLSSEVVAMISEHTEKRRHGECEPMNAETFMSAPITKLHGTTPFSRRSTEMLFAAAKLACPACAVGIKPVEGICGAEVFTELETQRLRQ